MQQKRDFNKSISYSQFRAGRVNVFIKSQALGTASFRISMNSAPGFFYIRAFINIQRGMNTLTKEGEHKTNWMSLKQMSEKHGIAESTLRVWKNSGYITSSTVDNVVMLDEASLTCFLDAYETKGLNPNELENLIKEKELEREVILSKYNDELFLLKTHQQHQRLFDVIIQELAALIMDANERGVFLAISRGEPTARVAKRYRMPHEKVLATYTSILETLSKNAGRIALFRPLTMGRLFGIYGLENPMDTPLTEVFTGRALTVLYEKGKFETIGELLRFTCKRGWNKLNNISGMGPMTYDEIIRTLENKHFIVQGDDGYISVSPQIAALVL